MKYIYNIKDLKIDAKTTLIIIDWDDTLYPTSWVMNNRIDLTDHKTRVKYNKYFDNLDKHLYTTLCKIRKLGEILIITNAMPDWIDLSLSVLPKTKEILSKCDIISARQRYHNKSKMTEWKKLTFNEEIINRLDKKKINNILSLGDAEYERYALISLYNLKKIPHKYLKFIKFTRSPDYHVLIEQITIIRDKIHDFCMTTQHIDVVFDLAN